MANKDDYCSYEDLANHWLREIQKKDMFPETRLVSLEQCNTLLLGIIADELQTLHKELQDFRNDGKTKKQSED